MGSVDILLDKYRKACSIASDNALGADLGITRQSVFQWRKGLAWPGDEHVVRMANKIGETPEGWLAAIHADRTSDKVAKKVWLQAAQRLGYAAAITLAIGISPARAAGTIHASNMIAQEATVYIMRNLGCGAPGG